MRKPIICVLLGAAFITEPAKAVTSHCFVDPALEHLTAVHLVVTADRALEVPMRTLRTAIEDHLGSGGIDPNGPPSTTLIVAISADNSPQCPNTGAITIHFVLEELVSLPRLHVPELVSVITWQASKTFVASAESDVPAQALGHVVAGVEDLLAEVHFYMEPFAPAASPPARP